jgi:ribosomal protein S18 acetylase RimI-like enzyme
MDSPVSVTRASVEGVPAVVPLFEAYCRLHGRSPGQGQAEAFLREQLEQRDAVLLVAAWPAGDATDGQAARPGADGGLRGGAPAGFALLRPRWRSTVMRRDWWLDDLYVVERARRCGVATSLLLAVERHARDTGAKTVRLKTQRENAGARRLYESMGWTLRRRERVYQRVLRDGDASA